MTKKREVQLKYTVLCEQVRREDNGKLLLIGVYQEAVIPESFPALLPLTFWMNFTLNITKESLLECEIRSDIIDETIPFSIPIWKEKISQKNAQASLALQVPFTFKKPGSFSLYYKTSDEKEWQFGETFEVWAKK